MEVAAQSLMWCRAHSHSFCLIESHCSRCSVSTSAQVALTAATRQHLGLCIFSCVSVCVHCPGAGVALSGHTGSHSGSPCPARISYLSCNAVTSQLRSDSAFCFFTQQVFFLSRAQRQRNMCHFYSSWTASQKGSCYFLQLSGGAWDGL